MNSQTEILRNYEKYVCKSSSNFQILKKQVKQCNIPNITRLHLWRFLLGILDPKQDQQTQLQTLNRLRQQYAQISKQGDSPLPKSLKPKQQSKKLGPLVLLMNSQKNKTSVGISQDHQLKNDIIKDVQRTYQQMEYFKKKQTKKLMQKILMMWCRKSQYGYKQGMNQILASVVYIYHEQMKIALQNKFQEYLSKDYQQADIYFVFDAIMKTGHAKMFAYQAQQKKADFNPYSKNQLPILQRIAKIVDQQFKQLDMQLFRHIKLQEVQLRPYLLRWIRCMHTRQLPLNKALILWDNIFLQYYQTKTQGLQLIDFTCIAMLSYLREQALQKQQGFRLMQLYQQYPQLSKQQIKQVLNLTWSFYQILKGGDTTGFDPASTKHLFMFQKGFSDKKGTKDIYIPTKLNIYQTKQTSQTSQPIFLAKQQEKNKTSTAPPSNSKISAVPPMPQHGKASKPITYQNIKKQPTRIEKKKQIKGKVSIRASQFYKLKDLIKKSISDKQIAQTNLGQAIRIIQDLQKQTLKKQQNQ